MSLLHALRNVPMPEKFDAETVSQKLGEAAKNAGTGHTIQADHVDFQRWKELPDKFNDLDLKKVAKELGEVAKNVKEDVTPKKDQSFLEKAKEMLENLKKLVKARPDLLLM